MKKVSKKIVGITGANGALGSEFIKKYKKKFIFKIFKKKIENKKEFKKWIKNNQRIKIFLHFAAISSVKICNKNPRRAFLINTHSTIKILDILNNELKSLEYFLFSSSSHVYKPTFKKISENSKRLPISIYGKSKKKSEDYIIKNLYKFNFKIGIARIFNFYTSKHKKGFFIHDIKERINKKKAKILFKRINTNRDYININQLCEILFFMVKKKINRPLNIGSSKSLNLIDLIKMLAKKYTKKNNLIFEKRKYPGLLANISLLRKMGYKRKINRFLIK